MKKLLVIFSTILIGILPVKIIIESFNNIQMQASKDSEIITMGKYTKNKKTFINNELFYYKNYSFNEENIYDIDSKEFSLFLKICSIPHTFCRLQ